MILAAEAETGKDGEGKILYKNGIEAKEENLEESLAATGARRREADIIARHNNEIKRHKQPQLIQDTPLPVYSTRSWLII